MAKRTIKEKSERGREDLAATVRTERSGNPTGSARSRLTVSLLKAGLVDEVRLMINPVVLGAGPSVFSGAGEKISLRLLTTRAFDSGNVLLSYEPVSSV